MHTEREREREREKERFAHKYPHTRERGGRDILPQRAFVVGDQGPASLGS